MTGVVQPALAHACAPDQPGGDSGTAATTTQPRRVSRRLVGIDAARGIALLGMMAVHNIDPLNDQREPTLAWTLSAGKSAALFAVVAGVGIALATGGRRRPSMRTWPAEAASLLVRAALIGAVGLLLGRLVPDDFASVILPYYALLFVLAIPLLRMSSRALVELAVAIGVGVPIVSHILRAGTEVQLTVPNLTFQDLAGDPSAVLRELALTGAFPALPWMAYLCTGLAVGRAALSSRRTIVRIIVTGAALVVGARTVSWFLLDVLGGRAELEAVARQTMSPADLTDVLTSGWAGTTPTDTGWWLATMTPHSTTPLDLASTIGVSLVVLGCAILVGRATTLLVRPLSAAGSMTLTLYCLHLVLLSWPAMPGDLDGFLIQSAVVVGFALLWSRFHARGPLEEIVAQLAGAARRGVLAVTAGRRDPGDGPVGADRASPPSASQQVGATAPEASSEPGAHEDVSRSPAGAVPAGRYRSRLLGVDATRGLALLLLMAAYLLPGIAEDRTPTTVYVLGSYAAAMFVLLAGVGVALSTGGWRQVSGGRLADQVVVLIVRAVAIAAVGLALGYVVSAETDAFVVLVPFGMMFLLAIPLLRLTARGLVIAALAFAIVVPVLVQLSWGHLPGAQEINYTFGDVASAPGRWLVEVAVTGVAPALPWMAYFCAGMAVGRLRSLTSRRTATVLLVGGAALAALGKLASWALLDRLGGLAALERAGAADLVDRVTWGPGGRLPRPTWWWLGVDAPYSATPADLIYTAGVVLGGLGLVLLLAGATGRLLRPLAAVGSMTLTLYTVHLLALSLIDLPWGNAEVWLAHTGLALVVASVWLSLFRRGPLESLIAALASRARRAVRRRPTERASEQLRPVVDGPPHRPRHLAGVVPPASES